MEMDGGGSGSGPSSGWQTPVINLTLRDVVLENIYMLDKVLTPFLQDAWFCLKALNK